MNSTPTPVQPDEHLAISVLLLRLLAVCGALVAIGDYFTGHFVVASASVAIVVLVPLILLLSRHPRFARLPLLFTHWLLFGLFLLGALTQFPYRPEKVVWVTMFPVAYFYRGGLRLGWILSSLSLLVAVLAYFAVPRCRAGRQHSASMRSRIAWAPSFSARSWPSLRAHPHAADPAAPGAGGS